MKYRIFIFMIVFGALIISSCGDKEPVAPESKELSITEQDVFLAKKPGHRFTPWEGVETTCNTVPGEQWYEGDIWHIRGQVTTDIVESQEPRAAGVLTVNSDIDLNMSTGEGTIFTHWSLKPDVSEGTWEGRLAGNFSNFLMIAYGIGVGTGDLRGMIMTVKLEQRTEIIDPPCETALYQFDDTGYIIGKK